MENNLNINDLFLCGAHFGKPKRFSHPAMKQYIYGMKKGSNLQIIDLEKTLVNFEALLTTLKTYIADQKKILFVSKRNPINDFVRLAIKRTDHYYITERWWGGTLTNWKTIQTRILHLKTLLKQEQDADFMRKSTKRERGQFQKQKTILMRQLEGILTMNRLPDAIFLLDPYMDKIACLEAKQLKIPVFAFTNINVNSELLTQFVVLNNRSQRVIHLAFTSLMKQLFPSLNWTDLDKIVAEDFEQINQAKQAIKTNDDSVAKLPLTKPSEPAIPVQLESKTESKPSEPAISVKLESKTESKPITETDTKQSNAFELDLTLLKRLRQATLASWAACKQALVEHQNDYQKALNWLVKQNQVVVDKQRTNNHGLVGTFVNGNQALILDLKCETDFVARNQIFQQAFQKLGENLVTANNLSTDYIAQIGQPIINDLINKFHENISFVLPAVLTKTATESFAFYNHTNFQQTALLKLTGAVDFDPVEAEKLAMHVVALQPKYITEKDLDPQKLETLKAAITKQTKEAFSDRPEEMIEKIVIGKLKKKIQSQTLLHQKFVHQPEITVEKWLEKHQIVVTKMCLNKKLEG